MGQPRVLVVDDDRMLVPLLERGLRYKGFEVWCAYGGAEAIEAAREHAPDLVLLDIGMPDRDGLEVLAELRRASDVPVVVLTARDEVADKVAALDSGADDYLAKPFALDELLREHLGLPWGQVSGEPWSDSGGFGLGFLTSPATSRSSRPSRRLRPAEPRPPAHVWSCRR